MALLRLVPLYVVIFIMTVIVPKSLAQDVVPLQCGEIVQVETTPEKPFFGYRVQASAGTTLYGRVEPIGATLRVALALQDVGGNEFFTTNESGTGQAEVFSDLVISSSNPTLYVGGTTHTVSNSSDWYFPNRAAFGAFTLSLGCILPDGTEIPIGGGAQIQSPVAPPPSPNIAFGFLGVQPRDFSTGIEVPLTAGQPQVAPIGGDVALYTYQATAAQTATLNVARMSGDISIGVAVIKQDTNKIIFFSGLPSSNNLSVDLTFPSDGTYAIGLFRIDTAERAGTSGAVQVSIE